MSGSLALQGVVASNSAITVIEPTLAVCSAPDRHLRQAGCDFSNELLSFIPQLRAFAWMLSGDRDIAEDLAQETLAKAWRHRRAFQPGTNPRARRALVAILERRP